MQRKHNTKKITIALSDAEIRALRKVITSGRQNARTITRARILLLSHQGKTNRAIVDALGCAPRNVTDVRKRYDDRGSIDAVLTDAPRPGQPKKITPSHEAFVIATACTKAPDGHSHWTLPELRKALLKQYTTLKSVSDERVRRILLAASLKPWREKNVVRAKAHA